MNARRGNLILESKLTLDSINICNGNFNYKCSNRFVYKCNLLFGVGFEL